MQLLSKQVKCSNAIKDYQFLLSLPPTTMQYLGSSRTTWSDSLPRLQKCIDLSNTLTSLVTALPAKRDDRRIVDLVTQLLELLKAR